jgi:hypothetical protein
MKYVSSTRKFTNMIGSSGYMTTPAFDPLEANLPSAETFENYFTIVNGRNKPLIWNGSWTYFKQFSNTSGTGNNFLITGTSVIPKFVKGFKEYLFFAYTTESDSLYRSRLRWCAPGDISSWPADNYLDLDADDGDFITGLELLGDYLIVFKQRKIFVVKYVGGEDVFAYELVVYDKGCISSRSIAPLYNDLFFLAHDGYYKFNGSHIVPLSANIKDHITAINPQKRELIVSDILEAQSQVWLAVPYLSSTSNNKVFVLNYEDLSKPCWFIYDLACASLCTYSREDTITLRDLVLPLKYYDFKFGDRRLLASAPTLLSSDYSGNIYNNDEGYSDNGIAFTAKWASAYLDFSSTRSSTNTPYSDPEIGRRNKRVTRLILWIKQQTDQTYLMTVRLYTDYDEVNYKEFTISTVDSNYPSGTLIEKQIPCSVQGREFKVEVLTSGVAESWELHKVEFVYDVRGRTKRT